MPHDPEKYLYDMQNSCIFLLDFTAGKTIFDYELDRGFWSAVERELQIIGEALIQLDRVAPEVAARITDYLSIIGFRHVLVHGYDRLESETVWEVIETKLELLLSEVQAILPAEQ